MLRLSLFVLLCVAANAQWQLQQSNTAADLRGIHSLGNGIAWASGTEGTILRTTDMGQHWQHCTTPPAAEHLDFRGIQAFDAQTAIVMSSGKGDLSRLYKTTDACQTWKLVFSNPDKEGFWDGISFPASKSPFSDMGYVIGDPVSGVFALFETADAGTTWHRWQDAPKTVTHCKRLQAVAKNGEALFAASNTSLLEFFGYNFLFVTGGHSGSRIFYADSRSLFGDNDGPCKTNFPSLDLPLGRGTISSGSFAMAAKERFSYFPFQIMVVGGDFGKPDESASNAAFLQSDKRGGRHFEVTVPTTPPHGYRSSVAYDPTQNAWITVGPNGTDLSTDDGRNWHPLRPSAGEAPDSDRNWNALSLPFVVGPHGRIGLLNPAALANP